MKHCYDFTLVFHALDHPLKKIIFIVGPPEETFEFLRSSLTQALKVVGRRSYGS